MRVLVDAVGLRSSGGATVVTEVMTALPRLRPGWTWDLFLLPRRSRSFELPDMPDCVTVREAADGDSWPGRLRWLRRALPDMAQRLRADCILNLTGAGCPRPPVPSVNLLLQAKVLSPLPCLATSPIQHLRLRIMRGLVLRSIASGALLAVQTAVMRDQMTRLAPELARRVRTVRPGGLPISSRSEAPREGTTPASRPTGSPVLCYVSHGYEHKNHKRLIQAMPRILGELPEAMLCLTLEPEGGAGTPTSPSSVRLERLARSLGVDRRIQLTGTLRREGMLRLLDASDLCVYPSLMEAGGAGLVEMLCSGLPVAVSDRPYARELCRDAAVYFDPMAPEAIARCVVDLWRDEATRARLRQRAEALKDGFSYELMCEDLAGALEEAHHGHRPGWTDRLPGLPPDSKDVSAPESGPPVATAGAGTKPPWHRPTLLCIQPRETADGVARFEDSQVHS